MSGARAGAGAGARAGWLRRFPADGDGQPRVNLVCLPYGGRGSSMFRSWPKSLPGSVQVHGVELPGRERRFGEPAITDVGLLIDQLAPALEPLLDLPVVLFGHSMGSVLAYRLAVAMKERFATEPVSAVLSSAQAPWTENYYPTGRLIRLSDEELLTEWERWGGPVEEFRKHPDLLDLMLPTVRADFELVESVRGLPGPAPSWPARLVLLAGQDDPLYSGSAAGTWQAATTGPVVQHDFAGGHYFVDTDTVGVLQIVSREVALASELIR